MFETIKTGDLLLYTPTHTTFRVLCNCPDASPRHFTKRFIQMNPTLYRVLTPEELAQHVGTPSI